MLLPTLNLFGFRRHPHRAMPPSPHDELALLHVTDEIDEVVRLVGESYQAWQDTH